MKRIILILTLALSLTLFMTACKGDDGDNSTDEEGDMSEFVVMKARILNIGDRIEVDVIDDQYNSGIFHVIVSSEVKIFKSGNEIEKNALQVGDEIEIYYSGQVMLSYPPQIAARRIVVK